MTHLETLAVKGESAIFALHSLGRVEIRTESSGCRQTPAESERGAEVNFELVEDERRCRCRAKGALEIESLMGLLLLAVGSKSGLIRQVQSAGPVKVESLGQPNIHTRAHKARVNASMQ
jgi:hypothetical protein